MRRSMVVIACLLFSMLPARADACGALLLDMRGAPVGATNCTDVRPGVQVQTPRGFCSLNFLFLGSDGHRYIGTAGHCILAREAPDTVFRAPGPVARVAGQRIGEFAYAVDIGSHDFALIRLDPGVPASPSMAHFGGPTGLYADHELEPVVLHHYGRGLALGSVVPARTAIAPHTLGESTIGAYGAGVWGDSGSGVIDSRGRAVGVLVTLRPVAAFGTNGLSRVDHHVGLAASALGIELTLQTAPLESFPDY